MMSSSEWHVVLKDVVHTCGPSKLDRCDECLCYIMSAEVTVCRAAAGSVQVYLKMWIAHTLGDLLKQRFLDFLELCRLDDVENLLDFPQEHDLMVGGERQGWGGARRRCKPTEWSQTPYLFLTAGFRPKLQKPSDHLHVWKIHLKSCSSRFVWVAGSGIFYTPYTNSELEALCF